MAYTGTVDLISGIRPKNGGSFPLVDAADVRVTDDARLSAKMALLDRVSDAFGIADGETRYATKNLKPLATKSGVLLKFKEDYTFENTIRYQGWGSGEVNHNWASYAVTPGVKYYITGDMPGSGGYLAFAAFFDDSGGYISMVEKDGDTLQYVNYEVTAPADAATILIIHYNASAAPIACKEELVLTGSALVDGIVQDVLDVLDRVGILEETIAEANAMTVGTALSPLEVHSGYLYKVQKKTEYGNNDSSKGYSFYTVEGGKQYFFTATASANVNDYPAGAFYDKDDKWISSFGQDPSTQYEDALVTAPGAAVKCVLERNNGLSAVALKEAISKTLETTQQSGYNLNTADALLVLDKRNPFAFDTLDGGYVTFVFDDLTSDIDLIAAVFAEYGYPVCFAAIPGKLNNTANGLSAANGDYTVGMTIREVMTQAVADGGEILTHNSDPITASTMYDFETMYDYFIQAKKDLEAAGFKPRGIIRAGGTGAISRDAEFDRWMIGSYEYSNMGTLPQYAWDRINTNVGLASMKSSIDTAVANHTWIRFMAHGLNKHDNGEAMSDESKLREILTYCQTAGAHVVTVGYIFDHFGSSVLAQAVAAL